ncbi:MAG: addiction module antidote protein [Candidatus Hydrogenedentota bacterium]
MDKLKIRRIGNSLGAIIPAEMLARLHIAEGDEVHAIIEPDGIKLTPYDPEFDAAMEAFETGRRRYRNALKKLAE